MIENLQKMNTFVKYQLLRSELSIDLHDAAPLLGYENTLPDDILVMVQEVMDETAECFDICGGYQIFENIAFDDALNHIRIENIKFHLSRKVYRLLKHSERIAVFVCTAGEGISQWSKQKMANNEPLKGFIADILGSVVVEAAIDAIQQKLRDQMPAITNRYSPGYCGWPTAEQHKLFSLFPEGICGIRLTESALMQPVKSVSGFIGIGSAVRFDPYPCRMCEATQCVYRDLRQEI